MEVDYYQMTSRDQVLNDFQTWYALIKKDFPTINNIEMMAAMLTHAEQLKEIGLTLLSKD